jgi:acetyl-CoA synthetase
VQICEAPVLRREIYLISGPSGSDVESRASFRGRPTAGSHLCFSLLRRAEDAALQQGAAHVGGRINASYNCVDRHLAKYKNKTAIHFVPEPEHEPIQHVTYQDLYARVNEVAALLQDFCGLKKGDRVTLHMPMVPELPITMLACARLGIIHSQVFSGFSGKATADRIVDSESRLLITMDAYYRGGQLLDQKEKADVAVSEAEKEGVKVEKVLVWQRYPGRYSSKTPLVEGRDFVLNELLSTHRRRRVAL